MNFIKKIVDGKIDDSVHLQFQKFSKGEFRDRAVIKAKQSKGKFNISTTAEFANELVRDVAEKLGGNRTRVTGAIVSTMDLKGKIDFKEIKQFQGVKRYLIDNEMSGNEIISLLEEFPKNFFALSFEAGETKLKIKPKAPKSGKPGKENEEGPKADFCKLKTDDSELGGSFVFETPDFREAVINHTFFIDEMVISPELKKSNDFARMREEALRKGRIVRKANIDGKETVKEINFEA